MRIIVLLTLLLSTWAGAQIVDSGVVVQVDEFTGERECSQFVVNSENDASGISLSNIGGVTSMLLARDVEVLLRDSAFNVFGLLRDEVVYLRFADDEIVTLSPIDVGGNRDEGYEFAFVDPGLIPRVLAAPADLRVRFSGPRGEHDFTIYGDVVAALARGFGQQCM